MRRLLYRLRLWLHTDVSLCSDCVRGSLCAERIYLARRAGLRGSLWV